MTRVQNTRFATLASKSRTKIVKSNGGIQDKQASCLRKRGSSNVVPRGSSDDRDKEH